jgi:hypothetical protein
MPRTDGDSVDRLGGIPKEITRQVENDLDSATRQNALPALRRLVARLPKRANTLDQGRLLECAPG